MSVISVFDGVDRQVREGDRLYKFEVKGAPKFAEVERAGIEFFIDYQNGRAFDLGDVDIWIVAPNGKQAKLFTNFNNPARVDTDDGEDSDRADDHDIDFNGTDSKSVVELFLDGAPVNGTWALRIKQDTGKTLTLKELGARIEYNYSDIVVEKIAIEGTPAVGNEIDITATAANLGNEYEGPFSLDYFVDGVKIGSKALTLGLDGGKTWDQTLKYTVKKEGKQEIEVRVRDTSREDTSNNTRKIEFTAGPDLPDLMVVDILPTGFAVAGETMRIVAEVENTTSSYRLPFTLEYFVNGRSVGTNKVELGLGPGQNWDQGITYTVRDSGLQKIEVKVQGAGDGARTELYGNYRDGARQDIHNRAEEVEIAAFLARAVYGDGDIPAEYRGSGADNGRDDDYRGYLERAGLDLLDRDDLGAHWVAPSKEGPFARESRWQDGGLFEGKNLQLVPVTYWAAQGLLAETRMEDGVKTLFLAFRGTDDDDRPLSISGQAWSDEGLFNHYDAHQSLIDAALSYANDPANGIGRMVVTGHSLGGSMADIFAGNDSHRLSSGVELSVVSFASAGVDPAVWTVKPGEFSPLPPYFQQHYADLVSGGPLPAPVGFVSKGFHIGISHSQDRVTYTGPGTGDDKGLAPNFTLASNENFETRALDLPGVVNLDRPEGFGAEHDIGLYWASVSALVADPLVGLSAGAKLVLGNRDYDQVRDLAGKPVSVADGLLNGKSPDDVLIGPKTGFNYLMGFEGDDRLLGGDDRDLLSGGSGDDEIAGGGASDVLSGGRGNDVLDGGAGLRDEAVYSGASGDYTVSFADGRYTIRHDTGTDGTDTLTAIELVRFRDGLFDIDRLIDDGMPTPAPPVDPALRDLVEMYVAYFDRAPDTEGLYYWFGRLQDGMTMPQIAASFFVQPESQAAYPNADDNAFLVRTAYDNLLQRSPDAEGEAYWVAALDNGDVSRAEFMLAIINGAKADTGSPEDARVIGQKGDIGIDYAVTEKLNDVEDAREAMELYDRDDDVASLQRAFDLIDRFAAEAAGPPVGGEEIGLAGLSDALTLI